jgi:hypothetical protein
MLSSSIAIFARAVYHFFQESGVREHIDIHLDTILVIVRYSTICFINDDFPKYLNRTMNMMNTYTEYIKILKKNSHDPVLIANDAFQLILHRFPSIIRANSTCANKEIDFRSEIAMCTFLEHIKRDTEKYRNDHGAINSLAEEIYRKISIV